MPRPVCKQRVSDVYEPHYRRVNLTRRELCTATGMPVVTESESVGERNAWDEQVAADGDQQMPE